MFYCSLYTLNCLMQWYRDVSHLHITHVDWATHDLAIIVLLFAVYLDLPHVMVQRRTHHLHITLVDWSTHDLAIIPNYRSFRDIAIRTVKQQILIGDVTAIARMSSLDVDSDFNDSTFFCCILGYDCHWSVKIFHYVRQKTKHFKMT